MSHGACRRGFDYVIAGAGAAGCILAARLSADPSVRVLLLEAGASERRVEVAVPAAYSRLFRTSRDWAFSTVPQPGLSGRRIYWPRGRMLGGSTAMNDMVYVRGNRADYDGWAAAGNRGWGYDDVLPYFRRSENQHRGADSYHGAGGPLDVTDARFVHPRTRDFLASAADVGLPANNDFNGPRQDGVGLHQVTQRDGRRCSAASAFLRPVMHRRNLVVVTGAQVARVVLRAGRATGMEWVRGRRLQHAYAAREVLLAAGAVGTPHLLLLSGVGPAAELAALGIRPQVDLPGVGQALQDHLMVPVSWVGRDATSMLDARTPRSVLAYAARRAGPLSGGLGQASAFVATQSAGGLPDVQLVFVPLLLDGVRDEAVVEPTRHGFSIGAVLLHPEGTGRIRLRFTDPGAAPAIDPGYLRSPRDVATLVRGVELALAVGEAAPLRAAGSRHTAVDSSPMGLRRHVQAAADTMFHPVGTCRMGSDPDAVVDDVLRVRGVAGLRVVDASVMPRIPRGNTAAATMMVAERAADLVTSAAAPGERAEVAPSPAR